jgi:hypothetical protein
MATILLWPAIDSFGKNGYFSEGDYGSAVAGVAAFLNTRAA